MDSILTSVKKMLGIVEEDTSFDMDLIIHINSVLMILNQLGVGPTAGFTINDKTDLWSDFIPEGSSIEAVKSFMYMKVRLLFDPPISGTVTESYNKMLSELEWRINTMVESGEIVNVEVEDLKTRVTALENKTDLHDEYFEILVGDRNA